MEWWARKVATAVERSRESAVGRWAATNAAIASAFDDRTVTAGWAVDVRRLVRHFPVAPLVERMSAPSAGPVTALLLPLGPDGQDNDIPYASQPWAGPARARGPLTYSHVVVRDGEAEGRLADAMDATLARDRRRYIRSSDSRSRSWLREWSLDLVDNPLSDAWLLGILYATMLLAPTPITHRKSL
jgi:hypothetical protein